jgi:O-antigen/teichoic acid export membrane protein
MRPLARLLRRREVVKESLTFAFVLALCLCVIVVLCGVMPDERGATTLALQSVFSALLAVPAGASWRSLRCAIGRYGR